MEMDGDAEARKKILFILCLANTIQNDLYVIFVNSIVAHDMDKMNAVLATILPQAKKEIEKYLHRDCVLTHLSKADVNNGLSRYYKGQVLYTINRSNDTARADGSFFVKHMPRSDKY